jgi:glyoxylate reductase
LEGIAEIIFGPDGGELMPRDKVLALAPRLTGIVNQAELRVDAELLDAAPNLRIVANVAVGTDNLDLQLMRARDVVATNVPDAFVDATADCTMGLLLAVLRRLVEADRFVRSGAWRRFQPGRWDGILLRGQTLGVVGFGRIGQAVAQRAAAFGLRVIHHNRKSTGQHGYVALETLLQNSDIVSIHVPLNPDSLCLLNAERLAMMKPSAYLLNLARGRVVDEKALVAALARGALAGAGLDVFEDEPRVEPRLLEMPNVVLLPHIGGGTRQSRLEARRLCAQNVANVLRGSLPLSPV